MAFIPVYIFILFITILIDYFAAIYISRSEGRRRKLYLIISIVSTCLVLFIFKYFNFFNSHVRFVAHLTHWNYPIQALSIILPVGLSFHTFQSLAYVIEVYRGHQKPEHHFGIYALYVMFYPQLVAGPIEGPQNMLPQFYEKHEFDYDNVTRGLKRMLWGFFKKVVVADRLALYVNAVFMANGHHNGTTLAVAVVFFAFQIYCDFSGYSDIAIGSAQVMGFKLVTNFNRPFLSKSVTEYWRRWHISLTTWFNTYLFTPIMVQKRHWGKFSVVFALLVTFFVSGLWHGAAYTYISFGLVNGIAVCYEFLTKKTRKKVFGFLPEVVAKMLSTLLTFAFACFAFVFFRSGSMAEAFSILGKILFMHGELFTANNRRLIGYSIIGILIVVTVEVSEEYGLFGKVSFLNNSKPLLRYSTYCLLAMLILLFGVFGKTQFIYFQF